MNILQIVIFLINRDPTHNTTQSSDEHGRLTEVHLAVSNNANGIVVNRIRRLKKNICNVYVQLTNFLFLFISETSTSY